MILGSIRVDSFQNINQDNPDKKEEWGLYEVEYRHILTNTKDDLDELIKEYNRRNQKAAIIGVKTQYTICSYQTLSLYNRLTIGEDKSKTINYRYI